jgi:hypothetical protein
VLGQAMPPTMPMVFMTGCTPLQFAVPAMLVEIVSSTQRHKVHG